MTIVTIFATLIINAAINFLSANAALIHLIGITGMNPKASFGNLIASSLLGIIPSANAGLFPA
jgi:hypothetical protein